MIMKKITKSEYNKKIERWSKKHGVLVNLLPAYAIFCLVFNFVGLCLVGFGANIPAEPFAYSIFILLLWAICGQFIDVLWEGIIDKIIIPAIVLRYEKQKEKDYKERLSESTKENEKYVIQLRREQEPPKSKEKQGSVLSLVMRNIWNVVCFLLLVVVVSYAVKSLSTKGTVVVLLITFALIIKNLLSPLKEYEYIAKSDAAADDFDLPEGFNANIFE